MNEIIHITSGESVASCLLESGIKNVYAFNEAMCEGDTSPELISDEFCRMRAKAYGIDVSEYTHFGARLKAPLRRAERAELFFDYDMFCAVNTITLLAYFEKIKFTGEINFNMVAHDGTANVLEAFPITLGGFENAYNQALVSRRLIKTGVKHIDKVIPLYLKYKQPDNEITRYIKENAALPKSELCAQIIINFPDYGIGDSAIIKLIDS